MKIRDCTVLLASIAVAWVPDSAAQTASATTVPDEFRGLPDLTIQYYDVDGTDEASISAALDRNAPRRPDGSKAMGAAGYKMGLRPQVQGTGAACKVVKPNVRISATVILPRLVDEAAVAPALLARWKRFVAALRVHEAGHVRIEYQHIRDAEKRLVGSPCETIYAKFEAARDAATAAQRAYDQETNHGATQGAILQ